MIADFNKLVGLDLTEHVSKKPTFKWNENTRKHEKTNVELDYLNWADCLELLHVHGATKVMFGNIRSAENHPLFLLNGVLPFIRIYVDIDDDRRELDFPLIDGSTDIKMEKIEQSDIHNATQRAFVKCVAINWGLGLSLWQKEEKAAPVKTKEEDPMFHNLFTIKTRIEQLITAKMKSKDLTQHELCERVGLKDTLFTSIMTLGFSNIDNLERKLREL